MHVTDVLLGMTEAQPALSSEDKAEESRFWGAPKSWGMQRGQRAPPHSRPVQGGPIKERCGYVTVWVCSREGLEGSCCGLGRLFKEVEGGVVNLREALELWLEVTPESDGKTIYRI